MVFVKFKVDPARTQAKIAVNLTTTTPQLSLSDENATLDLKLSLRITSSKQEGRPVTLCVDKSVFQVSDPGEGGMDMFSRGAFGIIRNADLSRRGISLGYFKVHEARRDDSSDLRELGYRFITVPGDGSSVEVTHRLSWERIFRYEEKRTKADLEPGEKFEMSINRGYLGTIWWCWGDLEGDLKGKKLHEWQPGSFSGQKPSDEFVKEGNLVLGEELRLLDLEDVTEDRKVSFEIVE
ncbi:hypothetical protein F5Y04DRAFT_235712 [Hypomontagnella monticulosa]|nr:hypothetical protein F5Y04DRAFT_235712 [Hypomontagnella monticulosa]